MPAATTSIKVFLSHSSVDKDLARRLARDLQAAGIDVWLDQWEIQVGEAFAQTIEKGVEDATYVLVLLTPASVTSHWVDREWRQKFQAEAKTQRVSIVPVRGEPCQIPDFLAQRSYADISGGSYPLGFKYLLEIFRYYADGADIHIPGSVAAAAETLDQEIFSVPSLPVVAPISLEVGTGLIPLFEPDADGKSLALDVLMPQLRASLQRSLGFPFPGIRVRGNAHDMPPHAALIMIDEVPEVIFEVALAQVVVAAPAAALAEVGIAAAPSVFPGTGEPCSVISASDRPVAATADYTTWDAAEYILAVLKTVLRRMAAEFLNIDTVCQLVETVEAAHPKLVASTLPKVVSWYELTDVLRRLVEEEISIGEIVLILEALSCCGAGDRDTVVLAEKARHALRQQITQQFLQGRASLPVITLSAEIETLMTQAIQRTAAGSYLALDPHLTQEILSAIRNQMGALKASAVAPVILTVWEIRRYVRKLVELEFPRLPVLSHQDLEPNVPLQLLAKVGLEGAEPAPAFEPEAAE